MERKIGLLVLLAMGIVVSIAGFALGLFLPALVIVALIVGVFLSSDYWESQKKGRKDFKKNAAIAAFVIVTVFCMASSLWILWAGITAMLYVDSLADSIMERRDARHRADLDAVKAMRTPVPDHALQSIRKSLFLLERRINVLEQEKRE